VGYNGHVGSFVQSELLRAEGVLHGFSTRHGGVSAGAFSSLNLGRSVGDDPTSVQRNHEILAANAGFPASSLRTVSQVHGVRVVLAAEVVAGEEGDAVLAVDGDHVAGVKTADCVPVLLLQRRTGAVAAVHAGWRGTRAGIVARAVERLGDPSSVVAAIGPCIRRCCYQVSPDLAADFAAAFGPGVAEGRFLDLVEANRVQLAAAGVSPASVEVVEGCTSCHPELFFSHRRDAGRSGRHLSFIAPRG
jgi:YfiH family protein